MLTLRCTLLRDVCEGGRSDNPRDAEWPPSWMRLFSALVSVAEPGTTHDSLLIRLEEADAPEIHVSDALFPVPRTAFVPTNSTGETAHGTLVARTNSQRSWPRAVPRVAAVWFHWPEVKLGAQQRDVLRLLARRIAYLGRSTSPTVVELVDEVAPDEGLRRLMPRPEEADAFTVTDTVRCPGPGDLDALRSAHEANTLRGETVFVHGIGRAVEYGVHVPVLDGQIHTSPYVHLVMFQIEGLRLDGRHTARATHAFRRAVLSRAERPLAALHGHHDGTVTQCAFLGLPVAGHEWAKGHLLGLAVAVPDLPAEEAGIVNAALGGTSEALEVRAGPLGVLRLRRLTPFDAQRAWGLQPQRWTGRAGGATRWTTVLPIVLDRHFKRGSDPEAELARAVVNSGFPEPVTVESSKRPRLRGGLDLAPRDTLRRPGDQDVRPYRHASITFAEPVRGPVVIGSMRHYGLGLCVPDRAEPPDA